MKQLLIILICLVIFSNYPFQVKAQSDDSTYPNWNALLELVILAMIFSFVGFIIRRLTFLSFLGSIFLMVLGIYMTVTRYVVLDVYYDSSTKTWVEYISLIPYYPLAPIFIALIGVIMFMGSYMQIKR